jgi:hypothetical protein
MTDKDQVRSTEEALSLEQTLRLALEALERCGSENYPLERKAITAIKAALSGEAQTRSVVKDEPVVGTKTWFEDGKVVTQNLYYTDVYITPAHQEAKDESVAKAIAEQAYESGYSSGFMDGAIKAIEAKGEPVCDKDPQGCWSVRCQLGNQCKNTPPQRTWVGLTDEEIAEAVGDTLDSVYLADFRKVEAKLKEKNT